MKRVLAVGLLLAVSGCATQTPQTKDVESSFSADQQRAAQEQMQETNASPQLALKRKLAVGRLSNETNYGRSLLTVGKPDALGSKVTDMFLQALTNSDSFQVFERPDIALLKNEANLSGKQLDLVGVDTLVIGSLTQFGRSTTGERGFLSSTKKQEATATVDLRLVDVATGRVFASVTGTGSSSTESGRVMGFGSAASYDGSLNDQAIAAAVTSAVDKMLGLFMERPWTADILADENGLLFISGGEAQGVRPEMVFDVETRGKQVKSKTTGTTITLPGTKVGELKIVSLFGDDELNQGAAGTMIQGSVDGYSLSELQVKEQKQ